MDLSLERWEGFTPSEREAVARELARQLPSGFTFHSLRLHQLGEQQHQVAFYQYGSARFALVPGGTVTLGYDAERLWEPNPDELQRLGKGRPRNMGCGSTTLFRWGDHVPCDRYPTDISPVEAAWRRKWVLSLGRLEYPPEGFIADWDYHRQPNAFGLFIASDPYKYELMAEIGTTRGGDGGWYHWRRCRVLHGLAYVGDRLFRRAFLQARSSGADFFRLHRCPPGARLAISECGGFAKPSVSIDVTSCPQFQASNSRLREASRQPPRSDRRGRRRL